MVSPLRASASGVTSSPACALHSPRVLPVCSLVLCLPYSLGAPNSVLCHPLTYLPTRPPNSLSSQSSSLTQGPPGSRGERGEKVRTWGKRPRASGVGMGAVTQDLGLLRLVG